MIRKLLISATVVISSIATAQESTSSPYSFYGLGSLKFKGTVENRSMGGISVYSDSIHINLRNPSTSLPELEIYLFNRMRDASNQEVP